MSFNVFVAALLLPFCLVGLVLGLAIYLIARYLFFKRKGTTSRGVESLRLKGDVESLVAPDQVARRGAGHVEIVLGDLFYGEPLLEQYVQCLKVGGGLVERIHVGPYIPADKLEEAINACRIKSGLTEERALLLIDDSSDLTVRQGLLVTDKYFYFKPAFGEGCTYYHRLGFDGFEVKAASIFRMGNKCIAFRNINADAVAQVFLLLNSYFIDYRAWCEKGAQDGDSQAQFNMSMYAKTKAEGLEWLRRAAEQGHCIAQGNLGAELAQSDLAKSYYWLSLAAKQGNEVSIQRLSSTQYDPFR